MLEVRLSASLPACPASCAMYWLVELKSQEDIKIQKVVVMQPASQPLQLGREIGSKNMVKLPGPIFSSYPEMT